MSRNSGIINMGEFTEELAEKVREVVDCASEKVLVRALCEYLDKKGTAVMKPVVEMERLKRKPVLTPKEVTMLYSIQPSTLADWRSRSKGPRYHKVGGGIRYPQEEVRRFFIASTILTGDDDLPLGKGAGQ